MFGATEEISGTEDPVFKNRLMMIYFFSAKQEIFAEVIDHSSNTIVGKAYFTLADILTAPNQELSVTILKVPPAFSKEPSFLVIRAEHLTDCLDEIKLKFGASLPKSVLPTRTYITLSKYEQHSRRHIQVARSDVCSGDLPAWNPIQVSLMNLCDKDYTKQLKLVVHKATKEGSGEPKGFVEFTLGEILAANTATKLDLLEIPSKLNSPVKKKLGAIFFESKEIIQIPQFVDFVFGGLELYTAIGIDFSNKQGSFLEQNSQHYFKGDFESLCEATMRNFFEVLTPYSPYQALSCFGFGASPIGSINEELYDTYSSCFLLTDDDGISNNFLDFNLLKESYRKAVSQIEPHQIRFITPVVETIVANLKKDPGFNSKARYYNIILLIEDDIEDIQELIDYMVQLNEKMPVTLLLIGMGKGPYPSMDGFQAFKEPKAPFYDSKGDVLDVNAIIFLSLQETKGIPNELVKEVLKFIPDRVLMGMMKAGLSPQKLRSVSDIAVSKGDMYTPLIVSKAVDDFGTIPLTWE